MFQRNAQQRARAVAVTKTEQQTTACSRNSKPLSAGMQVRGSAVQCSEGIICPTRGCEGMPSGLPLGSSAATARVARATQSGCSLTAELQQADHDLHGWA